MQDQSGWYAYQTGSYSGGPGNLYDVSTNQNLVGYQNQPQETNNNTQQYYPQYGGQQYQLQQQYDYYQQDVNGTPAAYTNENANAMYLAPQTGYATPVVAQNQDQQSGFQQYGPSSTNYDGTNWYPQSSNVVNYMSSYGGVEYQPEATVNNEQEQNYIQEVQMDHCEVGKDDWDQQEGDAQEEPASANVQTNQRTSYSAYPTETPPLSSGDMDYTQEPIPNASEPSDPQEEIEPVPDGSQNIAEAHAAEPWSTGGSDANIGWSNWQQSEGDPDYEAENGKSRVPDEETLESYELAEPSNNLEASKFEDDSQMATNRGTSISGAEADPQKPETCQPEANAFQNSVSNDVTSDSAYDPYALDSEFTAEETTADIKEPSMKDPSVSDNVHVQESYQAFTDNNVSQAASFPAHATHSNILSTSEPPYPDQSMQSGYGSINSQYPQQLATQYPQQLTTQYPQQPMVQYAEQPANQYQQHSMTQHSQQPPNQYQQQPAAQYQHQPSAQYSQQPVPQYPQQALSQYAQQPAPQYPQQPVTQHPVAQYQQQPAATLPANQTAQAPSTAPPAFNPPGYYQPPATSYPYPHYPPPNYNPYSAQSVQPIGAPHPYNTPPTQWGSMHRAPSQAPGPMWGASPMVAQTQGFNSYQPPQAISGFERASVQAPVAVPVPVDAAELMLPPGRHKRPKRILIILRGLPGSGKTFAARKLRELELAHGGSAPKVHCIDDYFMQEVEVEVAEAGDARRASKKRKEIQVKYCYEAEMEATYMRDLVKSALKSLDDKRNNFVIVDAPNMRVDDWRELWSAGQVYGFEVYVQRPSRTDPALCHVRNTHERTLEDVQALAGIWEPAPALATQISFDSLTGTDKDIKEVDMEEEGPSKEIATASVPPSGASRWETGGDGTDDVRKADKRRRAIAPDSELLAGVNDVFGTASVHFARVTGYEAPSPSPTPAAIGRGAKGILKGGSLSGSKKAVRWPDVENEADQEVLGFRIGPSTRQLTQVWVLHGLGPPPEDGMQGPAHRSFEEQVRAEHTNEHDLLRSVMLGTRVTTSVRAGGY